MLTPSDSTFVRSMSMKSWGVLDLNCAETPVSPGSFCELARQLVCLALQVGKPQPCAIFHHQLEPAGDAEPGDRRRAENQRPGRP